MRDRNPFARDGQERREPEDFLDGDARERCLAFLSGLLCAMLWGFAEPDFETGLITGFIAYAIGAALSYAGYTLLFAVLEMLGTRQD